MAEEATETTAEATTAEATQTQDQATLLTSEKPAEGSESTQATEQTETKDAESPAGAPEKYELQAPEGVTLDTEILGEFEGIARELNLSNEAANKLIPIGAKLMARQADAWSNTVTGWAESTKSDKEIGGDNLNASLTAARSALERFGTPELMADLGRLGIGNHPELVRVFSRIGKAMSEESHHVNGSASTTADPIRAAFPSMNH